MKAGNKIKEEKRNQDAQHEQRDLTVKPAQFNSPLTSEYCEQYYKNNSNECVSHYHLARECREY